MGLETEIWASRLSLFIFHVCNHSLLFNGKFVFCHLPMLFNGKFAFCYFPMLFNGMFAFCHFPMLFNGNLRIEKLGGGTYGRTDGRTYVRTDIRKFTRVLQDIGPLRPLPKKKRRQKEKPEST